MTMIERKTVKVIAIVLAIVSLLMLSACSSTDDYSANIYALDEDEQALVLNPSIEYVVTALNQVETITGIELDPDPHDNIMATVYFTSNLVDQSGFGENESVHEKGTDGGGSIDIFETVDEAIERDEYLHGFDDNFLLNAGGHAVVGSLVIRTSKELDEEAQESFTENIVTALTSGNITEDLIEQTMKELSIKTIRIPFSHEDVAYKAYTEVEQQLRDLGFSNIDYNVTEMNYTVEEESDGGVLAVHIDGEWDFGKEKLYSPDASIIISYVIDKRIQLPKSSSYCEERDYKEIVALFTNAGFTNVKANPNKIEYTESVANGSVVIVSVENNPIFDEGTRVSANAEIIIQYRDIQPKPAETQKPVTPPKEQETNKPIVETEKPSGNTVAMVWIPTNGGTKYHSRSGCSNMENPVQVTLDEAQSRGFTACKRCH